MDEHRVATCNPTVFDQQPDANTLLEQGTEVVIVTGPEVVNIVACDQFEIDARLEEVVRFADPIGPISLGLAQDIAEASQ